MADEPKIEDDPLQYDDVVIGIVDVIFGLGVALANAGVIDRFALADNMSRILQQTLELQAQNPKPPHLPSRQFAAKVLRGLFSMDLQMGMGGLRVIDGDKKPEISMSEDSFRESTRQVAQETARALKQHLTTA